MFMYIIKKNRSLLAAGASLVMITSSSYAGALDSPEDYVRKTEQVKIEPVKKIVQNRSSIDYLPYLEVGGKRFFKAHSKYATSFDLFLPFWQSPEKILFSDLKIYDRPGSAYENNFHLGYRQMSLDREHLYGIFYGFFFKKN